MTAAEIGRRLMVSLLKFNKLHMRIKPQHGLRPSEMFTLFTLKNMLEETEDGVKVTDLSTYLDVAPPTVSQNLKSLEKAGYIQRSHSTRDRRTVLLTLSDKGRALFARIEEGILKRCIALTEFLGRENSRLLGDLLARSYDFMKRYDQFEE